MLNDLGLLFLRVNVSALLVFGHGMPKLLNFTEKAVSFSDPLNIGNKFSLVLAIFGEVICPIFVAIGLKTRYFSVPPLITMLVAAFIVHAGDPWSKVEFPLVFAIPFFTLMFLGSGRFSADHVFFKHD